MPFRYSSPRRGNFLLRFLGEIITGVAQLYASSRLNVCCGDDQALAADIEVNPIRAYIYPHRFRSRITKIGWNTVGEMLGEAQSERYIICNEIVNKKFLLVKKVFNVGKLVDVYSIGQTECEQGRFPWLHQNVPPTLSAISPEGNRLLIDGISPDKICFFLSVIHRIASEHRREVTERLFVWVTSNDHKHITPPGFYSHGVTRLVLPLNLQLKMYRIGIKNISNMIKAMRKCKTYENFRKYIGCGEQELFEIMHSLYRYMLHADEQDILYEIKND
ncbi:MAG: hypothetical protein D6735_09215 [Acidobacteria bacterium]|nr:MAG: hypothetical protein D6735_09215 [Acidobacteriota bacterium]